ncbi:cellulose synthase family protein [Roseibacillus ishigakijimensis]|uniref:Glycosyltransferase family 2 protein n=1 Tax=Roseibacillus ishigakijimensis TaxID=454146 RepID=A0A934VMT8_9BACT|nr:cellulose synthase family protein [Roseibacillus ishigakijimensis]MBK1834305.1 glycosyltransferase family 2 protein [Roseibacillus ishigakijimensis]
MEAINWFWFVSYVLVLVGLSAYSLHRLGIIFLYLKHSRKKPIAKSSFAELPVVTVQLPVFNERHVVKRLLKAVADLDYPTAKLHIQFLDDSTDDTTEIAREACQELSAKGFDVEFIHRTDRSGFKAGALENGMKTAKGEFIFILDADFVPNKNVLMEMVHHFTDERVGLIQTRWGHLNRSFNLLTRVQAMFLDGHLELEQTARNRSGRFFTFNGTAGIWRKSCIVDAGGWEHDTLTEDMDLSYRAQLKGWKFIFLNEVETPAELPVDMNGFKNQQHRWTKGSIQVCKKVLPAIWKSRFPLYVKLEATAHLTANFAYLLLFLLLFLIFPNQKVQPDMPGWAQQVIYLPIMFFGMSSILFFYVTSQKALRPDCWFRELKYLPLLIALGIGMSVNNAKAVLEAIFNRQSGFVRTPKYGEAAQSGGTIQKRTGTYKAGKSITPLVEFIFGLFFLFVVGDALMTGNLVSFIFLLPFPIGFLYTSLASLAGILLESGVARKKSPQKVSSKN